MKFEAIAMIALEKLFKIIT